MVSAPDQLHRPYFYVAVDGAATSESTGALLRLAAERLDHLGLVDVHDIAFAASTDSATGTTGLTVYYDRIERRREER